MIQHALTQTQDVLRDPNPKYSEWFAVGIAISIKLPRIREQQTTLEKIKANKNCTLENLPIALSTPTAESATFVM